MSKGMLIFSRVWFITCTLLFFTPTYSSPSLFDLLTTDVFSVENIATFESIETAPDTISSLRFFLLTKHDCSEGLIADYQTPMDAPSFATRPSTPFILKSPSVYQLARQILGDEKVESIHSILIRFRGSNKRLSWFHGTCADQGNNCCIPIDCSNATGLCIPRHEAEVQTFNMVNSRRDI